MLTPVHSEVPRVTSAPHTSLRNAFIKRLSSVVNEMSSLQTKKKLHVIQSLLQQLMQISYVAPFIIICLLQDHRSLCEVVRRNVGDILAGYHMDKDALVIDTLVFCQPDNENKPTKDVTLWWIQSKRVLSVSTFVPRDIKR